jgi:hypothetical protein
MQYLTLITSTLRCLLTWLSECVQVPPSPFQQSSTTNKQLKSLHNDFHRLIIHISDPKRIKLYLHIYETQNCYVWYFELFPKDSQYLMLRSQKCQTKWYKNILNVFMFEHVFLCLGTLRVTCSTIKVSVFNPQVGNIYRSFLM